MKKEKAKLTVRKAEFDDVPAILDLVGKVYSDMPPYPEHMIRGQINSFPDAHLVAIYEGQIIGYCASIRISGEKALKQHTWKEITGGGYGSTHDEKGDYLYGYEVCVDPNYRRLRIGRRFYNERKKLCKHLHLKGIVFAGRLPNLAQHIDECKTVKRYLSGVKKKKFRDPVLEFQIRNGFQLIGHLENYLPNDKESLGYAAHLLWKNPAFDKNLMRSGGPSALPVTKIRVATVQYKQRSIKSFAEFETMVTYFIDVVADYRSDFVVFPELFTMQLLSIKNEEIPPHKAIEAMTRYTARLHKLFNKLAVKYNVNIIAGSHPSRVPDDPAIYNVAHVYLRDGRQYDQPKIHPTPNERYWWNISGGSKVQSIPTDCGPIGVLVCYDSEFPELARHLVNQGVNVLFVPFLTDERQAYWRVRYCCQARAIENQIYVVMSGSVGNLPRVSNVDIHYSQSCILTPCDFPFSRDGIAADTTPNVETVAFADLRIDDLIEARHSGTVRNLQDRRHDLYQVKWLGPHRSDRR